MDSDTFIKKVENILSKKQFTKPERAIILGLFLMLTGGGLIDFTNTLHISGFTLLNGLLIWFLGVYFALSGGFQWIEGRRATTS